MTDFYKYSFFSVTGRDAAKNSIPEYINSCSGEKYSKFIQETQERMNKKNIESNHDLSL